MATEKRIMAQGPEGTAPALPTPPSLSSRDRAWDGVIFERHLVPAGALPQHTLAEHCLLLPTGETAVPFRCTLDGRKVADAMVPGKIQFRAAGTTVSTEWDAPLDGIFMALSPEALAHHLDEDAKNVAFKLLSDLRPTADPVVVHLTWALDAHLRSGGLRGRLFEDALLKALCATLATSYGTAQAAAAVRRSALSQRTLRKVREFIQDNLAHEFGIDDIARAACLSPHHLGRSYHQATGQSLWQYVLESRAELARTLITAEPGATLADIAARSGFESYSQFIAVFRKAYGLTPGQHRRLLGQNEH